MISLLRYLQMHYDDKPQENPETKKARQMTTKKYIEEGWNDFVQSVYRNTRVTEGTIQYIETRRAFYAGAASVLSSIMDATIGTTEEEDLAVGDAVKTELGEWAERLAKGEV